MGLSEVSSRQHSSSGVCDPAAQNELLLLSLRLTRCAFGSQHSRFHTAIHVSKVAFYKER